MRLAILSDIHGNPLALDAVLTDIRSQGEVDAYWVLGDFAALGYDPVTPLEKVTALSHASFTRGNTDRYVVTEDLPVQPQGAGFNSATALTPWRSTADRATRHASSSASIRPRHSVSRTGWSPPPRSDRRGASSRPSVEA